MGIMSIVKNVIEHFRKAGKTENEISGMIEQAADRATVNKGVTEKKENEKPEITASSEETIRLQTERDTYKTMYEQLLNRLVNGGAA
jgi:type I restriction-modification system DNA methylase subunit